MDSKFLDRYGSLYRITSDGVVYSTDKLVRCHKNSTRTIKGKELKGYKDKDGYRAVILTNNGVQKSERIHRLVMEVFVGFSDLQVDHLNGIKSDNRVCNLEYVTSKENTRRHHIKLKGSEDLVGVNFNRGQNTYKITRWIDGKLKHFGTFKTVEQAVEFNKLLKI